MNRTNIFFGESHSDWLPVRGGESGDFVFRRGDGHGCCVQLRTRQPHRWFRAAAFIYNRLEAYAPLPPQLPRHRSALHDAHDLTAELAVDDRPPRDKGNERYLARQDTAIHEVSKIIAPHRSGLASSRRLDDWRLLGGSITGSKERQPQRHQHCHCRGVTNHGPRCIAV